MQKTMSASRDVVGRGPRIAKFEIDPIPTADTSPLIKWPGGKRAIIGSILPLLPSRTNTYFEPFLGGAALFFATKPRNSILSDTNEELINLYLQVRDAPEALVKILRTFENSEDAYYQIRSQRPRTPLRRAARLLYLTTLSFNGIHRVNLFGQFNVPYGHKTHLPTHDERKLFAASRALSSANLMVADFEGATRKAGKGDLVYFDPPYTVAHAHNGFVKYNERIFSWDDQIRLAKHARALTKRGCHVIISNANHASVQELYRDFSRANIERFSRIAASSEHRRRITETIYYSRNLGERD